ncbi:hypothetical protein [Flagellimonas meridianipacifica]|uniref:Uncharacterized protein n=1 Tax=Flagellimonas meridianipacifica TaxID=1080225 RepID=A0A2T0M6N9_9FLAO|nr:hypothetical protein [Allomuricauda pacifica]PRX53045.1 hypothetical protein CLV81_3946 [Allomuricauda pacifica]
MKKTVLFLVLGLLLGTSLYSQIKIGENPQNLDASSVLELESTTRALVITRVTNAQMLSITPLRGAMVYNTDTQCVHFYTGTEWFNPCATEGQTFSADANVNPDPTILLTETVTTNPANTNFNFEVGVINGVRNIAPSTIIGDFHITPSSITSLQLGDDSVTLDKLADGLINGQLLQWNGTEWELVEDSTFLANLGEDVTSTNNSITGTQTGAALVPMDLEVNVDGTTIEVDVSGLQIADNAITNDKMADDAINTDEIVDNAVTSAKILDGEIVDADVNAAAAIEGTKINPNFGAQNIATTGTLAAGNTTVTGTLSSTGITTIGANSITNVDGTNGQVLTTDGAGNATWQNPSPLAVATTTAIDGNGLAATPLDLADNAVTSAKILDGEIVDADVNAAAAIEGTKINPNFGAQNIATTGTLAAGNTTVNGSLRVNIREDNNLSVTILDSDYTVIVDNATDIDLPAANATNRGRIYVIKNLTGVTISMSSDSFVPSTSAISTPDVQQGVTQIQSDGTSWQQIN